MDLELEGNAALVTASTSGLGLGSARALASEGANVTICGRTEDRLEEARETVEADAADGAEVLARQADITDPGDVTDLVETTVEAHGGLDHVVTSAGGVPSGPFLEMDDEDWYGAYDTLVMSHVWTLEEAYPHLAESDAGTIVSVASTSVREVVEGLVLSNAVRRAVIGTVKTVSREFAPEVRANAILPGSYETPRIEGLIEAGIERGDYEDYEDGLEEWTRDIPMERMGDPIELGEVAAFLSSPRSGYLTGATIPVDGGLLRS